MSGVQRIGGSSPAPDNVFALSGLGFSAMAMAVTVAVVVATSVITGVSYHRLAYGLTGSVRQFIAVGTLTGFLFVLPLAIRGEFGIESFAGRRRSASRLVVIWSSAFAAMALIAFLTKSTATFSRGWVLMLALAGAVVVLVLERVLREVLVAWQRKGRIAPRRIMLIGSESEAQAFLARLGGDRPGVRIGAIVTLADGTTEQALKQTLANASERARTLEINDVVLLSAWSREAVIDACFAAFSMLPVAIHLDAGRLADRFGQPSFSRIGPATALALTEPPLAPLEAMVKRAFDIAVAALGLVVLAPVFAVLAVLIKRDSAGPVFFRQRRLGYNQREFRIWKFRSMTTLDDGGVVRQVQRGDARVTRIGTWMRRLNLDELPQLINVLRGEMSIVGPRPHAVAHDREFEKRIVRYPRRLNVKPGITGWAQVHGHRGETDTDAKMQARVEHDLYYIDNWSLGLDLYILLMTLLSARSYRNAF